MTQYTPDTSNIRKTWLDDYPEEFRGQGGASFNRWLASVKAEAWDEGFKACSSNNLVNPHEATKNEEN